MTQIELARKEIVSDEMQFVAAREGVDSQKILEAVAAGHLVIPANVNHLKKTLEPMAIGVAVRCKINANIGNSAVTSHVEEEIEKLHHAVHYGADTVMDLSTGGDIDKIRTAIIDASPVPIGTVPIYQLIQNLDGQIEDMTPQMFLDMAAKSDVVVENLSPGAMRRLGLGYEDVLKVNPKIIYASISGYGQTGPHSHRKAHDPEIQGMSGIMDINGDPDGPPMRVGFYIADLVTPIFTCYSILAALRNRDITGKGQYLDVSMMDTLTSLMFVENIEEALYAGEPLRMGNGIRGGPMGLYHTKDGDIIITVASDDQWERLAKAIGAPHLIEDPRFARFLDRGKNLDAARSAVQEILMTFTKKEALNILDQNDVPCSDVRSVSQIIDDQHFWDRGTLRSMRSQAFDEDLPGIVSGFPVVFSGGSLPQETGAPLLGQQNADIYGDILGIDESHLSRLEFDGVI